MSRALRASRQQIAWLVLWASMGGAAAAFGACLPEEITYQPEDDSAPGTTGTGGEAGAPCSDGPPEGGAGGSGGAAGASGAAPCLRCWEYALAGAVGDVCGCSEPLYLAYDTCICAACSAECIVCGGNGTSAECSNCYQAAIEEACKPAHEACVDD